MLATKIYPAIIRDFDVSDYRSYDTRELPKRLVVDVYCDAAEQDDYIECYIPLKTICSNREPCGQLYTIFAEAESWSDVLGQHIGVTWSLDGRIQKIVRTQDTITEEALLARSEERQRIKEKYKKQGTDGMTRKELIIALLDAN